LGGAARRASGGAPNGIDTQSFAGLVSRDMAARLKLRFYNRFRLILAASPSA